MIFGALGHENRTAGHSLAATYEEILQFESWFELLHLVIPGNSHTFTTYITKRGIGAHPLIFGVHSSSEESGSKQQPSDFTDRTT